MPVDHQLNGLAEHEPAIIVALMLAGALLASACVALRRITARSVPSGATQPWQPPPHHDPLSRVVGRLSVEKLGLVFDRSRRLMVAEELVARQLANPPTGEWMI